MELKSAILGFLDWKELTGYELKGMFSDLDFLPWSGNNNQIYTALIELEKEGLVVKQTIQQEKLPAQKRYTATEEGRKKLKEAVLQQADSPFFKNDFLLHLAWAECLSAGEVLNLIDSYQRLVETELMMSREKSKRRETGSCRSGREEYLWGMILQNRTMMLQTELNWLTQVRNGLENK